MSVAPLDGQTMDDFERKGFVLSVKLFHYWDTNRKPAFPWEVVELPSFLAFYISEPTENGASNCVSTPMIVQTLKLKTVWSPELAEDLRAYGRVEAQREAEIIAFDSITNELELQFKNDLPSDKFGKMYFYRISPTPVIYDPQTFTPRQAIMVRCATMHIKKTEKFIGQNTLAKHNFSDAMYERMKFAPYRWEPNSNAEGVVASQVHYTPEVIDELAKFHEMQVRIREIKQQMGYMVDGIEKETIL